MKKSIMVNSEKTEISDLQKCARIKNANTDLLIEDAFNRGFGEGVRAERSRILECLTLKK